MKNTFLTKIPIAHRGLHGKGVPENSTPAFLHAIQEGYAIETDVRFSKEGKLVVFHDDTLLRTTGDRRLVRDCTVEEIKSLQLENTNEKILLLREFLEIVDGKTPVLLEIKSMKGVSGEEVARAISKDFESYEGEYAVQSFNPLYVKAYRKLHPEILCGVLSTQQFTKKDFEGDKLWRFKALIMRRMSLNFTVKPDFISYRNEDYPTPQTQKFKKIKLAWTVRSQEEELHARKYAHNIIFEGYFPQKKQ